jgi:DNA polymerase-3 subunit gamma/tau
MGKSFYQEYRPRTLDEIIGQDRTVKNLKKRFAEKNFSQSFVLIGGTGLGKTTIQRIIAMAIVCSHLDEKTGYPCLKCEHCRDIMEENFIMSVHEKNCSNMDIEQMREMEDEALKQDFSGAKQVFILDEFQELSTKSSKNILKLIENENDNVVFIIGAMDGNKVPDAVKNRSQTFYLKPVDSDVIAKWMVGILDDKKVKCPPEFFDPEKGSLFLIADSCGGSPRTALSTLEQAIYSELWSKEDLAKELKIYSSESLTEICEGILKGNVPKAFSNEWTEELFIGVRTRFVDVYKYINGIEPKSEFFKQQISYLASFSTKEILKIILTNFFELNKFSYWKSSILDFFVIQSMNEIEKLQVSTVKRERVPLKG